MVRMTILALLALTCGTMAVAQAGELGERIDEILSEHEFSCAHWGIHVVSLTNDSVVFSLDADKRFTPASTIKLLTSAAALDSFGPDYRFETGFLMRGEMDSTGTLWGDLVVRGSGDPTMRRINNSRSVGIAFRQIADSLRWRGLKKVCGHLVGDARIWPRQSLCPTWEIGDMDEEWLPVPGALSLGRRDSAPAANTFVVMETAFDPAQSLAPSPTDYYLSVLSEALEQAGIAMPGCSSNVGNSGEPTLLYRHTSSPLSEIIKRMNKESDNFTAEQLGLLLGGGHRLGGLEKIRAFLTAAGVDTAQIRLADASGLSRKNLLSPSAVVRLLTYMYRHRFSNAYERSLAVMGVDGTLAEERTKIPGAEVFAKTGTLDYVSALSGFLITDSKEILIFSILCNNFLCPVQLVRQVQDSICAVIADISNAQPVMRH